MKIFKETKVASTFWELQNLEEQVYFWKISPPKYIIVLGMLQEQNWKFGQSVMYFMKSILAKIILIYTFLNCKL